MARHGSARELLQAVLARYRGLPHYADHGQVQLSLRRPAERGGPRALPSEYHRPYTMDFETARGEDGDFRFAFNRPHPYPPLRHRVTRHVIGRHQGQAYISRRDERGRFALQDCESLELAVAGATGISSGAAFTIAKLLLDDIRGGSPLDLQAPRLRAERLVDRVRCHRVRGCHPWLGRVTLYVGVDDLLLRRIVEHRQRRIETRSGIALQPNHPPAFFQPPPLKPMSSYQLYASPGAASLCVHWALLELQQPFELTLLDTSKQEQKSAAYLKLNPDGRIPTLIVDGKPHAETAALLMLLAERHPEAGLAPAVGSATRADYLQSMLWLANTLMPAFRTWFYPEEPAGSAHADAAKAQARAVIEACWERLAQRFADGRPYLLGDRMTAVDLLLTMLMRWSRNMPKTAECWPVLAAYGERQRARPALQAVHEREGLTEWIATGGVREPRTA